MMNKSWWVLMSFHFLDRNLSPADLLRHVMHFLELKVDMITYHLLTYLWYDVV